MTGPRTALLLINPAAGGGRALRAAAPVERMLRAAGCAVRQHLSTGRADAEECAATAAEDWCVCLGGDGTLQAVAQGLWRAGGTTVLVPLPGGRGNDLCAAVGVPRTAVSALRAALADPRPSRLDLLHLTGTDGRPPRIALGVVSIGIDAAANARVERAQDTGRGLLAHLRGGPLYAAAALQALRTWHGLPLRITTDGRTRTVGGTWVCAVSNSGRYGAGMRISPASVPDDGRLEIVLISDISRAEFLRTFPRVFTGGHVHHPRVEVLNLTEAVTIEADWGNGGHPAPDIPAYADGEPVGLLPLQVSLLPAAIRLLVPRAATTRG